MKNLFISLLDLVPLPNFNTVPGSEVPNLFPLILFGIVFAFAAVVLLILIIFKKKK